MDPVTAELMAQVKAVITSIQHVQNDIKELKKPREATKDDDWVGYTKEEYDEVG